MKTLVVAVALALAATGCCTHQVEEGALGRLEMEVGDMGAKYMRYVDADPLFGGPLTEEQRVKARENERAWVGRVKGIVTAVKASLEK